MADNSQTPYQVKVPDIDYWRGNIGADTGGPVAIRALKWFVTEQYGVENLKNLSRELMNLENAAICELGMDLRLGVSVGKDVTIPSSDRKNVHIGINVIREANLSKPDTAVRRSAYSLAVSF